MTEKKKNLKHMRALQRHATLRKQVGKRICQSQFEKFIVQWSSTHLKKCNQWYNRTQFYLLSKISFVPNVYGREF